MKLIFKNKVIECKNDQFFTEYNPYEVKKHLANFLKMKGLDSRLSLKKKRIGYIIDCPGGDSHSHNERKDDCILYDTEKSNGFIFISVRCRHISCWDSIEEYSKQLNKEWGKYLNENYNK